MTPEPNGSGVLTSEHAGSAFWGSEPLVMMPEEDGKEEGDREDDGETEIDMRDGMDFGEELLPPENFLFDDDLSGGLICFDEVFDHGTCVHQGEGKIIVKFEVERGRGEERGFDQPLRHSSSGAASRHRAPPPMAALMTLRGSHLEVEFEEQQIAANCQNQQFATTQSTNMRRNHSDSMLAQNGRFHAILPAAVDVPAKRKRQR